MAGLKLTLPISFTDTTLPVLRDDPMLSAGSLSLYELGHPLNPVAGVPATATLVPNIAVKEAQVLIPTATAADLSANYKTIGASPQLKIERTGKGGLHGIVPKAAPVANVFVGLYGRAALAQYIRDNTAHEFFFSYWGIETRSPATGPGAITALSFANSPNATNLEYCMSHDSSMYPTSSTYRTGFAREVNGVANYGTMADSSNSSALGNGGVATTYPSQIPAKLRMTLGVKGTASIFEKTAAQVESSNYFKLFSAGTVGEIFSHSNLGPGSSVHYRTYIEDLTVSGRSFATVDALDKAEYTKHVLTAGGRYYSDTWTDPASFVA